MDRRQNLAGWRDMLGRMGAPIPPSLANALQNRIGGPPINRELQRIQRQMARNNGMGSPGARSSQGGTATSSTNSGGPGSYSTTYRDPNGNTTTNINVERNGGNAYANESGRNGQNIDRMNAHARRLAAMSGFDTSRWDNTRRPDYRDYAAAARKNPNPTGYYDANGNRVFNDPRTNKQTAGGPPNGMPSTGTNTGGNTNSAPRQPGGGMGNNTGQPNRTPGGGNGEQYRQRAENMGISTSGWANNGQNARKDFRQAVQQYRNNNGGTRGGRL